MVLNTIEILFIMMCCGLFAYFIGYVLGTLSQLKIRVSELEGLYDCDNPECDDEMGCWECCIDNKFW